MSGGSAGWVVMRGMQVRMRALLQVVVAWACGGDGASARTAAEALGGHGSPVMCVRHVGDRWSAGSAAIPATAHPEFDYFGLIRPCQVS